MPGLLTRRAVLLAGVQSAQGAAATLSPFLNGLLVSDLNINPNADIIERNHLRDSLSPLPYRTGRKLFEATFTFDLRQSPSLGVRSEWSPLLRMAGMSETATAATVTSIRTAALKWTVAGANANAFYVDLSGGGDPSITLPQAVRENGHDMRRNTTSVASLQKGEWFYGDADTLGFSTVYVRLSDDADPDSKALAYVQTVADVTDITYNFRDTSHEFGTISIYRDGLFFNVIDALVDITSLTFDAGRVVQAQARAVGIYTTPTDVALPSALYQTQLPNIAQSMAFTFDAFSSGRIPSWSVNFANQLAEERDVNAANGFRGMRYTGRAPVGQVTMQKELVATFPAYTRWENGTEMTWSATMGNAGTRMTFTGPSVQITGITETDIDGISGWQMDLRFNAPGSVREWQLKLD